MCRPEVAGTWYKKKIISSYGGSFLNASYVCGLQFYVFFFFYHKAYLIFLLLIIIFKYFLVLIFLRFERCNRGDDPTGTIKKISN